MKYLHIYKAEDLALSKDLQLSLQLCSATLTEFYLSSLDVTVGFDDVVGWMSILKV